MISILIGKNSTTSYQLPPRSVEINQREPAEALPNNFGSLLSRVSEMYRSAILAELKESSRGHIKENHLLLLFSLDLATDLGGIRITQLAERSGLAKQTVGSLVRQMAKLGLVAHYPDPSDGRAKLVLVTENGIELLLTGVGIMRDITERYTEVVGQRRMTQLHSTLKMLLEEFGESAS
ncbi:MAG: MarR family winged helix-turn-helix transcriptional regulator [Bacteroidetes bacterium]|nr:MarR family winged helix-turn-helix transcriptional regulator [Bacteroidota bacterium]